MKKDLLHEIFNILYEIWGGLTFFNGIESDYKGKKCTINHVLIYINYSKAKGAIARKQEKNVRCC